MLTSKECSCCQKQWMTVSPVISNQVKVHFDTPASQWLPTESHTSRRSVLRYGRLIARLLMLLTVVTLPVRAASPTLVQWVSGSNTETGNAQPGYNIRFPNPILPGNAVLCGFTRDDRSVTSTSIMDDKNNTYSILVTNDDTVNSQLSGIFGLTNIANGPRRITITFNGGSGGPPTWDQVGCGEFYNVSQSAIGTALDASTGNSNLGSPASAVAAGSMTTHTSGDLIFHWGFRDGGSGVIFSQGSSPWALLSGDGLDGSFAQYQVQASAGAINPALTIDAAIDFTTVAVALKPASAGTSPAAGIHVARVLHESLNGQTSVKFNLPTKGNLIVISYIGPNAEDIASISTSDSLAFNFIKYDGTHTIFSGPGDTEMAYAKGTTASTIRTATLNMSETTAGANCWIYDIEGADNTSPFDTAAATSGIQSSAGTINGVSITPTTPNGIAITSLDVANNRVNGESPGNGTWIDPEPFAVLARADQNNGNAIDYDANGSSITFQWTSDPAPFAGWANWASAFKAAAISNSPPAILVSVAPLNSNVQVSLTQSFTATVQNDGQNSGVTWSLSGTGCSGASCGTLSATSSASGTAITYTAPSSLPNPATVTLTAKSVTDPTRSASASITLTSPAAILVSVAPQNPTVQVTQTQNFTATVQNDPNNKGVNWGLSGAGCLGAACGTLSNVTASSVTYTAPGAAPNPPSVTVTATSVTDSTKSASTTVGITQQKPIRVHAGSGTYTDSTGQVWQPDSGFFNVGSLSGCAPAVTVSGTADPTLYKGARWGPTPPPEMQYTFPVANGSYQVNLLFAETCPDLQKVGARVFDVEMQGAVVFSALDIFAAAGANTALVKTATVTVTNGTLAIQFIHHTNNPIISGMEILPVGGADPAPLPISVAVSPSAASVQVGQSLPFTATVQNDGQNSGVTWSLSGTGCSGASCGTLSATSSASGTAITYTAPSSLPNPATVTLTAKSVTDPTRSASASITLTSPAAILVSVAPQNPTVQVTQTQNFTATVQNDPNNKGVNWGLSGAGCLGAACGTLSNVTASSVTYTAPGAAPNPPSVTVTATSVTDSTKSASTTVGITQQKPIRVHAGSGTYTDSTGQVWQPDSGFFNVGSLSGCAPAVTVSGTADPTLYKGARWGRTPPPEMQYTFPVANGSYQVNLLFAETCPDLQKVGARVFDVEMQGAVVFSALDIFAAAGANTALVKTATVTGTNGTLAIQFIHHTNNPIISGMEILPVGGADPAPLPISVAVSPSAASVQVGQSLPFTATVQNDGQNSGVTWSLSGTGCSGASCGTLSATSSASGTAITYTAPSSLPNPTTVTLTAKSVTDPTRSASASITLTSPAAILVSVAPQNPTVQVTQT